MKKLNEMTLGELMELAVQARDRKDAVTLYAIDRRLDEMLEEQQVTTAEAMRQLGEMDASIFSKDELEFLSMLGVEVKGKDKSKKEKIAKPKADLEAAFEKQLSEAFASLFEEEKKESKPKKEVVEEALKVAKEVAMEKNPALGLVLSLEEEMLKGATSKKRAEYLLDKYSSVRESMVKNILDDSVAEEVKYGLSGSIATYELVMEDLKRLL